MNKEKREGMEKMKRVMDKFIYVGANKMGIMLLKETRDKIAEALWGADIRDASGFEICRDFSGEHNIETGEPKKANYIKAKVFKDGE